MGYSDHPVSVGLSLSGEVHPGPGTGGFSRFNGVSVGVVVLVWALFGIAAAWFPGVLVGAWDWVAGLPMAGRIVVWVIGLPWMIGLGVWHTGWPELVRVAVVAALAVASVWTFYPNRAN